MSILVLRHIPPKKWWRRTTWELVEDLVIGNIIIPKGFVTDGVSTPILLSWLVSPTGKAMKSAIAHDYLLSLLKPTQSRKSSDLIFRDLLVLDGISDTRSNIMFYIVRLFGMMKVSLHNTCQNKK